LVKDHLDEVPEVASSGSKGPAWAGLRIGFIKQEYPFAGHRVLHLSIILAFFILRTFLVSYSGVLENLGKAFKLTYAKTLRCIAWPAKG
jgi:hypothetical protein